MSEIRHGGDCYRNQVRLDFSVNINPLGCPESVRKAFEEAAENIHCYPDPQAMELTRKLSEKLQIPEDMLITGNGASELLLAVFHAFRPDKVLLPVPSFGGYRRAAEAVGAEMLLYRLKEENGWLLREDFLNFLEESVKKDPGTLPLLVLTNPNNPTGRCIPHSLLEQILDKCRELEVSVLLDECFMELTGDPAANTCLKEAKRWPDLMILRAFTKSFAIPGVRLGYLINSDPGKICRIQSHLPEWNLSVFAQKAGIAALEEEGYLEKARQQLTEEREYLTGELQKCGFIVCPSETNFLLFHDAKTQAGEDGKGKILYQALLKEGILIRDCSDYPGLTEGDYRIAVKNPEENRELVRILHDLKPDSSKWSGRHETD